MPTNVLGLSAFYHDSAACLIQDGKIIAAASEERFTRKKHDPSFPKNAISFCLKEGGIHLKDLTHVGFYEKPWIKFERILDTSLSTFPKEAHRFYHNHFSLNTGCKREDIRQSQYCRHAGFQFLPL